jgi:hypothetical protein
METTPGGDTSPSVCRVRHYSVAEVAQLWNISEDSVRRLFEHEPDVMVMGSRPPGSGRTYRTLRIPEPVLERVHRRLSAA